ncbi:invasion associated locus B family protein [Pukyongiella litopenaei]|uniref:Invasion associated locus B family protein n=1 Tax=Pukyongiella litopenaei TaxID=2605946 RepID=A0A2S0MKP7_9RHOB|nr:invasion associated locus B family protein [Pukyongiella litopenaei]AVO36450.1 invasion associated locus B family protein [Pukyongiella litopenaei]
MSRLPLTLTAAALIAMTVPALAQDTATEEPEAATEATEATETPAATDAPAENGAAQDGTGATTGLDLGQPAGPQVGDRYSKEKHGDWDLACMFTGQENDPCSLMQLLVDDTDNAVAEVSVFRIANGGPAVAAATVVVPLETLLPAQLTIAVDSNPAKRYNYSFCNKVGCVAQIGLTQEDIDSFKKGNTATVSLVPAQAPDQVVDLKMSLSGFTAGYDVVDVVEQ